MKVVNIKKYQCSMCEKLYDAIDDAKDCESKPISHDQGAKVGDTVRITGGQCSGELAKVTTIHIMDKYWGHYTWERYWHTVAISADLINDFGTRFLTWDQYHIEK